MAKKRPSEMSAHLGFWMRMVSNHVSAAFARKLADEGVTVAEWALMRLLYGSEPLSPSRLAEGMGMTRGAITRLADRLIAKGLVAREPNADDRRAQTLALTERGAALVPALAAIADRNDAEFFGDLTSKERKVLDRLLRRLVEKSHITRLPTD